MKDTRLLALIEKAKKDPRLRNLDDKLAILQSSLDFMLERPEGQPLCPTCGSHAAERVATVESISRIVDRYAGTVEKQARITDGIKVKVLTEARGDMVTRMMAALREEGVAPEALRRIAARLR